MRFTATLKDWKWMRAAKAVRMFFELHDLTAAVKVSPLLEENVQLHIQHTAHPEIHVLLDPCQITDLQHKSKKYTLVCETCSESQNAVRNILVPVVGDDFSLEITDAKAKLAALPDTPPAPTRGSISAKTLEGLHAGFFKNQRFYVFLERLTGCTITSPAECKQVFKEYLSVTSCVQIQQEQFDSLLRDFNLFLMNTCSAGADGV